MIGLIVEITELTPYLLTSARNKVCLHAPPPREREPRRHNGPERRVHPQFFARILRTVPRRLAPEYLRGKGLIEFHLLQVAHFHLATRQQLGDGMHRPE